MGHYATHKHKEGLWLKRHPRLTIRFNPWNLPRDTYVLNGQLDYTTLESARGRPRGLAVWRTGWSLYNRNQMSSDTRTIALIDDLRKAASETSCAEFKTNNADGEMIGRLISALSNSARLTGRHFGYVVWEFATEIMR